MPLMEDQAVGLGLSGRRADGAKGPNGPVWPDDKNRTLAFIESTVGGDSLIFGLTVGR